MTDLKPPGDGRPPGEVPRRRQSGCGSGDPGYGRSDYKTRHDEERLHFVSSSRDWWCWLVLRVPVIRQPTFTCGCSVAIVKQPSLSSAVTQAPLGGARPPDPYPRGGAGGSRPAGGGGGAAPAAPRPASPAGGPAP